MHFNIERLRTSFTNADAVKGFKDKANYGKYEQFVFHCIFCVMTDF